MPSACRFSLRRGVLAAVFVANGCTGRPSDPPIAEATCPERPLEQTRRLYDFAPVSAANPAVARVDGCAIVITRRELEGHLAGEVAPEARVSLTREDKRRHLERLIDEHLLLDDAFRAKADEVPGVVKTLDGTRTMLLGEFLTAREVNAKAKTGADEERLRRQLLARSFERASIAVSNEAAAAVAAAARSLAGPRLDPAQAVAALPAEVRDRPVATFQGTVVTVGDLLRAHQQMPERERPDLAKRDGLMAVLQRVLEPAVLAAAAVAEGVDRTRPYLEKVEQNRSALVRMWSQDRSAARARQRMDAPDMPARLRQWHRERLETRYTYTDDNGRRTVLPFEGNEPTIRNDYYDDLRERVRAEEAAALRQGRTIVVDERALDET